MRIHPVFPLVLLCCSSVQAQYSVDPARAMRIDVPPGLHIDSVIASFRDTTCIGAVLKGTSHGKVQVYLEKGLSNAMEAWLWNDTVADRPLHCTMRVNALSVWEIERYASTRAYCGLNFELLTKTDSGWVRLYEHGGTTSAYLGTNRKGALDEFIGKAIAQGFSMYAASKAAGLLTPEKLPWPPIPEIFDASGHDWPVLQVGAPASGLYRGFQAFRDQHPDETCGFTIKPFSRDPLDPLVKVKPEKGCKKLDDCWGISDGKNAYINLEGHFFRLHRSGPMFTTRLIMEAGSVSSAVAVGIAFGLIGGAIYGAMLAKRPQLIDGTADVQLDMLTGSIRPYEQKAPDLATSDQLFVYDNACSLDTTLEMYVFGGLEAKLQRGGHHWLKLVPRVNAVPVEFRVGQGAKLAINIHTERVGVEPVVYSICVESNERIRVERLSNEAAKDVVRSIGRDDEIK